MNEYCIANDTGYYRQADQLKEFAYLEEEIDEDEQLLMAMTADNLYDENSSPIWNGTVTIVFTDTRMIYGKKGLFNLNGGIRSIPIGSIKEVKLLPFGNFENKLLIKAPGQQILFGLNKANSENVLKHIEDILNK